MNNDYGTEVGLGLVIEKWGVLSPEQQEEVLTQILHPQAAWLDGRKAEAVELLRRFITYLPGQEPDEIKDGAREYFLLTLENQRLVRQYTHELYLAQEGGC